MAEANMIEHGFENVTMNDLYDTYVHEVQDEDVTVCLSEDENEEIAFSAKQESNKCTLRDQESIPDEIGISTTHSTLVNAAEVSDGSISNLVTSKYHRANSDGSVDSCQSI